MIARLDDLVLQAVAKAFETMLDLKMSLEPRSADLWNGEPHIAGSVGFIGRISGIVYVYTSTSFARRITARLLGIAETEVRNEEMVNDAIGELTNMVVGQIKSQMSDRGMPCVLTIPSIVRGSHFVIESVRATARQISTFRCGDEWVMVETLIKSS